MKRLSIAVFTLSLWGTQAYAQSVTPPTNPVSVDNNANTLKKPVKKSKQGPKKINIAISPILFFGTSFSVSVTLSSTIAIRANGERWHFIERTARHLSIGLPIYTHEVYKGIFLEPRFENIIENEEPFFLGPQLLVGYHLYWKNVNLALAVGPGINLRRGAKNPPTVLAAYFQIGLAFW